MSMTSTNNLLTLRKSLDEICRVPDKITSVYSLEQHVWADLNADAARAARRPELQTLEEFQIDPVRPFLTDVLRAMAAPYRADRKDAPIGQGYWIQAEFGSGKSHLLCFLSALALGGQAAWNIIREKETKAGRGRRESLYRFWEDGLEAKSTGEARGIFVIVKTLVGTGGGAVGLSDRGQRLTDYILAAASEQIKRELGKNLSVYPAQLLADRFIKEDLHRYRADLARFLRDPEYFDDDEFEDIDEFLADIQQPQSPEAGRDSGNKLWRFYTDYLKVRPDIPAETEDILKHLVETLMAEGYSGVLLVLDEVSLFMKNRDDEQRTDDEQTLVVLSNRLAKVHNLPIWTVCAAQQAVESKMGVKNIIADDRLKLVKLLEQDTDYYDIVLSRVREIIDPAAVTNYYLYYKRGFTWPNSIGEAEFAHFFPFHKPALEVLRAITFELTTARSAIHFMHQTLKHQIKHQGHDIIRLWELFDETMRYEEDPSGVNAGFVAVQTRREMDYRAYEDCRRQIDGLTKGTLKVYRDKAVKTVQTLFLYHVAKTRQAGITPEEIANSVLIERKEDATPEENIQHYETLAENLRKELRQITQTFDEDNAPRYRFDPVFSGVDPRLEFQKARDEVESNWVLLHDTWDYLLGLDEWLVKTRQMTIDLSNGVRSMFRDVAPKLGQAHLYTGGRPLDVAWQGRQVTGLIEMRDLARLAADNTPLPGIETDQSDRDFAVFIGTRPASTAAVTKLLAQRRDPRVLLWTPAELTAEEQDRLRDFVAYRKLVADWEGKDSEDAVGVINWVSSTLQTEMGKIARIIDTSFGRGRIDALRNTQMEFHVAGELAGVLSPLVDRVLSTAYASRDITFEPPFTFRKEEGVKVINGIVKTGSIPKGAKPNQDISAAQNFGYGLRIMKKSAERELDTSDNPYVADLWDFIDDKLSGEGQTMRLDTLYKNFMGIGGPKDYGLSRRMVQIYLLCLVRQGKVRVILGPKSGLSIPALDYATLADVEFSARVLDALTEVQKMAQPRNWDVLRPYAEKLLGDTIPVTHDDAEIARWRAALQALFEREKDRSARTVAKARGLFEALRIANPYQEEAESVARLFATDISSGDDIALLLYGLKEVLGYGAFDDEAAAQSEVDDLANRLANYRDLERFLAYDDDVRAAHTYSTASLPDFPELATVRALQQELARKLGNVRPYIDAEVRLKTELIGHTPPAPGEAGTLGALIAEYTTVYAALHENVLGRLAAARRDIQRRAQGEELQALTTLEGITALQAAIAERVREQISARGREIFVCQTPSRASIEDDLKNGPLHRCGLSFDNADAYLARAEAAAEQAAAMVDEALDRKADVLLSPAVRERLAQGASEPVIRALLAHENSADLRAYLVETCLQDTALVETANRYLKRIVVKKVRLADFHPTLNTIEKAGIAALAREFEQFLEDQLRDAGEDGDTLPMLQVE